MVTSLAVTGEACTPKYYNARYNNKQISSKQT